MLLITCPWCGARDETEYQAGGEAGRSRPTDPAQLDDTAWAEFLFMCDNEKGWRRERWMHALGCRRWFEVERNTVTHEIATVVLNSPATPENWASPDKASSR